MRRADFRDDSLSPLKFKPFCPKITSEEVILRIILAQLLMLISTGRLEKCDWSLRQQLFTDSHIVLLDFSNADDVYEKSGRRSSTSLKMMRKMVIL